MTLPPPAGPAPEANAQDLSRHLAPTRYIDSDAPALRAVAERLAPQGAPADRRALALFAFVRDEIRFGFDRALYGRSASETLRSRVGHCINKSALYVALLRAAGVPARQVFIDIQAEVLRGIIDPGLPFVDHSFTEVFLDGRWIATDAFVVDSDLFRAAKRRLAREGARLGYGLHAAGTMHWNARAQLFPIRHRRLAAHLAPLRRLRRRRGVLCAGAGGLEPPRPDRPRGLPLCRARREPPDGSAARRGLGGGRACARVRPHSVTRRGRCLSSEVAFAFFRPA